MAGWCLLMLGAALASGVSTAQDGETVETIPVPPLASDDEAPRSPPDSNLMLEEIVVRAPKTQQTLEEVAISSSVVDRDTLAESGGFDPAAIEDFAPNVELDTDPQAPVIGIRGFSTETDNVGFEPSVGLSLDELAINRPEFIADGLFDIDRVEVFRGPQGSLFGKNTIAGVINIYSAEPDDDVGTTIALTGGSHDERRIEAGADLHLFDGTLGLRLAGVDWQNDGFIYNRFLDEGEGTVDQQALRLKAVIAPWGAWTLRLSSQVSNTDSVYPPWQLAEAPESVLDYLRDFDPEVEDDAFDAETSFNTPGFVDRHSEVHRAVFEYDAGDWGGLSDVVHTVVVGHAAFDFTTIIDIDVSPADILITDFRNDYAQNSIEARTAGRADSFFGWGQTVDFVVGLYALTSELDSHLDTIAGEDLIGFALSEPGLDTLGIPSGVLGPLLDLIPVPGIPLNDQFLRGYSQETESYAAFGQMTWRWTDRWSGIVGARYGRETKEALYDVTQEGLGLIGLILGAETFTSEEPLKRDEDDFSPTFGLRLDVSDSTTAFLTWARGYKGGGYNATANAPENLEFEPEIATSVEFSTKTRLRDYGLSFDFAAYTTDVEQLQVVDFDGTAYQVRNAAEARLRGIEGSFSWQTPWRWLRMMGGFAFSEALYRSYPDAPPPADSDEETQDLSGRTLANAPESTFTLTPEITFPELLGIVPRLAVDISRRGDQYSATDLDPYSFQAAYTLYGARLVFASVSDRWALVLRGRNLTDERVYDQVFDSAVFDQTYGAQATPERALSATLRVNF